MQTSFTLTQLADPNIAESEKILRTCVHCGFCTATCPTYVLLGDELDSPRGRIYLIKEMLERDAPATPEVVKRKFLRLIVALSRVSVVRAMASSYWTVFATTLEGMLDQPLEFTVDTAK